ncbi:MAG: hypothetical protein ACERKD_17130 [Prolixibacteraceae bacterium]
MNSKRIFIGVLLLLAMHFTTKAINYDFDLGTINPGATLMESGSTVGMGNDYLGSRGYIAPDVVYLIYIPSPLTLEINTVGSSYDTFLYLVDANDQEIALDDDSGGNLTSRITQSILSAGSYYIVVAGFGPYSGSYILNIITSGGTTAVTGGSIYINTTSVSSGTSPGTITNLVSPSDGTGSYTYQWQQSFDNANWSYISGATYEYYTVPNLYTTTFYRREVTSGTVAYSNSVGIAVGPLEPLTGGTITVNTISILPGTSPGTIWNVVSPSGGTGYYTYQWQQSADNANWSNISGAIYDSYAIPSLYYSTFYRLEVTSGTVAYSNTIPITVTSTLTLSGGLITIFSDTAPSGSSPNMITNLVSPSGGTGTYTYQWQQSTDNTNWSYISGANYIFYAPPYLYTSTYFRREVTSGTVAYSNTLLIIVTPTPPIIVGSITIGTTSVSPGSSPGTITTSVFPTGGTGAYAYHWQESADNANWSYIDGATYTSYTVPALYATTYYRQEVSSGTLAYSNTIQITVNSPSSDIYLVNADFNPADGNLSFSLSNGSSFVKNLDGRYLSSELDGSTSNEIQYLSFNPTTKLLTLSGDPYPIDLSSLGGGGSSLWTDYGSYLHTTKQVRIGTPMSDFNQALTNLMYVYGRIKAYEIVVDQTAWADFVFNKDYSLKPLSEVEQFIEINSHLPDVPSKSDVRKDGVNLGEMNAILLQKIEELTLYLLDQEKRILSLEAQQTNKLNSDEE